MSAPPPKYKQNKKMSSPIRQLGIWEGIGGISEERVTLLVGLFFGTLLETLLGTILQITVP